MRVAIVFINVKNSQGYNPNDLGYTDEECLNKLAKMDDSEYIIAEVETNYQSVGDIMERINFYDTDTEEDEAAEIVEEYKEVLDGIGVTDYDAFLKEHWCAAFELTQEELENSLK